MSDYLLKRRAISQGLAEKPPTRKEPKPIPKKSAKRIKEDAQLAKIKEEMKKDEGDRCRIQSPVCIGFVQGLNHKQKTSPSNRLVKSNLELSCNPCNGYIETHQEWAEANGHWKSKFKPLEENPPKHDYIEFETITVHDQVENAKVQVHDKI